MPEQTYTEEDKNYDDFVRDLAAVVNKHSREGNSNTPDFLLADFMSGCLNVYENVLRERANLWDADGFRNELQAFLEEHKDRMTPAVLRENLIQLFGEKLTRNPTLINPSA